MGKAKKKQLSEVAQQRRKETNKKTLNPFEVHINRDKQNVLGRKSKMDRGLPGVSRAKAIKKRKGTLLQEYKLKNKDNLFLDKRIGEKNFSMSQEDKAMARFAAERVKAHKKKNIFNLNDDETLTHRGQTLEDIERFDDPKSDDEFSDEDNRTGKLDNQFVDEVHFGGGILSKPGHAKSRKDIIEELIAESKKRKAEKQKIREQTLDLTEKLDSDWKDLLPIVSAANKSLEDVQDVRRADDFDMTMRQLKFEPRGVPSDKLKSEEDMMREEKEKLEALEKDRLARMKGFINGNNNEIKHKSADDLDDGFMVVGINETDGEAEGKTDLNYDSSNESSEDGDSEPIDAGNENNENNDEKDGDDTGSNNDATEVKSNNVSLKNTEDTNTNLDNKPLEDESPDQSENGNSEADESDADSLSDLKESESSSEDENVPPKKTVTFGHIDRQKMKNSSEVASILKVKQDANLEKREKSDRENEIRIDLLKRKEIMEKARKELPYTYSAPESFEELQTLLENQNPVYQSVIVDRIIKCNHWSLKNGENKEKLCNLFSYLLQHIDECVSAANPENVTDSFEILDRLSPYIYDLARINSESTKTSIQDIIRKKHEEFEKNKKVYPNLGTLILFKLVSLLFPTSDFRHPVVTPCLIFMSQILVRSRVKSKADIAKGIFICTLILEYTVLSKRFSPSAINFLRGVLYSATPKHLIQGMKTIPPFKTTGELSNLLIINNEDASTEVDPLAIRMKAKDLLDNDLNDDFKMRALLTAINLLQEFKTNFQEIEASYSIFEPILKLLKPNTFERYPAIVKDHIKKFETELEQLKSKNLEYIVMQRKKPKPLRMYEPRIERVYDGKTHRPMSKEKAEREKLLHKYKKEMKGAIREIRRDRSFLAKVQIKQQIKSDTERKRKVKEIFGEAAVQQSEFKKMKRKK